MPKPTEIARCLFPLAVGSAIGAGGLALSATIPVAATVVGQLVGGLAINYSSAWIAPLLGQLNSTDWSSINFDLERVARHALLTILYETLTQSGVDETAETPLFKTGFGEGNTLTDFLSRARAALGSVHEASPNRVLGEKEAGKAVQKANEAWDLNIFVEAVPGQDELIAFLRQPQPLAPARAALLARAILRNDYVAHQPNYAAAIADRFARTFEILLRGDERAYRASTIYLQRLALSEIEGLRADFARAIAAITRPQPDLQLYAVPRKKHTAPAITDLQFKRRATEFLFREPDKTNILEWLNSDHPFRILKITGPAGMGKSRLALQICDRCHGEYWLAGFLDDNAWPPNWTPVRDTLVVLDYAASKSVAGRPAFEWLRSLFLKTVAAPKVRVILIDRSEQGALWSSWKVSDIHLDLDELTLHIDLKPDRTEFDRIVQTELRRRLVHDPYPAHNKAVEDLIPRLRGQFRPLFGILAAAAVADNPQTHRWSPELLIESILNDQLRKWQAAGVRDEHFDLLFEATWTQGECNGDAGFSQRVETLRPEELASLSSLSESGYTLGPIVPDLLGEFFVLMRLRGEAALETRQDSANLRSAQGIFERLWPREAVVKYAGLVLEDFLAWAPQTGSNPALDIMHRALDAVEHGADSFGLQYCLFASAENRPKDRDWAAWLDRSAVSESKSDLAVALATGLYNATVVETDPAKRLQLADRIDSLHANFNHEPAVREPLARALLNATVVEPDPAKRLQLAQRIDSLHANFNHEPAVREQLAKALFNATVVETDPAKCLELAERIDSLHANFNHEPAVREPLAEALYNATVGETDPAKRLELADRIDSLHANFNHEPAVREPLAKALYNAAFGEPDPAKRLKLAERIDSLHANFNHEPAVREQLAKALVNANFVETDPAKRLQLAERIDSLHANFNHEPAVREQLAKALFNATVVETDPAKRLQLADRIDSLHANFNHEPAVRELLAEALVNAAVVETDPDKRLQLAERIDSLHANFNHEPAVRELLAKALVNATVVEPDPAKCLELAERIDSLHANFNHEPAVRELLAKALVNATFAETDPANCLQLADRIDSLHANFDHEPAVREALAKALINATFVETDPAKRAGLIERLSRLASQFPDEPFLAEALKRAKSI